MYKKTNQKLWEKKNSKKWLNTINFVVIEKYNAKTINLYHKLTLYSLYKNISNNFSRFMNYLYSLL